MKLKNPFDYYNRITISDNACKKGNLLSFKILISPFFFLKKIDINDFDGTFIQTAAMYNQLNVIKYLVKKGANVNLQPHYKWTSYFGTLGMTIYGKTALMNAAENGHIEVVKYLLKVGAEMSISAACNKDYIKYISDYTSLAFPEINYVTALSLAQGNGHHNIVELLLNVKVNT